MAAAAGEQGGPGDEQHGASHGGVVVSVAVVGVVSVVVGAESVGTGSVGVDCVGVSSVVDDGGEDLDFTLVSVCL